MESKAFFDARKELIKGSQENALKIVAANISEFTKSIESISFAADIFCMNELNDKALIFIEKCYTHFFNDKLSGNKISDSKKSGKTISDSKASDSEVFDSKASDSKEICSELAVKKLEILSEKGDPDLLEKWIFKVENDGTGNEEFLILAIDSLDNNDLPDSALKLCKKALVLFPKDLCIKDKYYHLVKAAGQKQARFSDMNTDETELLMLSLFRGRDDVFARQVKFKKGSWGYIPVRSSLDKSAVSAHLKGDISLGIYQLDKDSMVSFLAFDLDIKKKYLAEYNLNESDDTSHDYDGLGMPGPGRTGFDKSSRIINDLYDALKSTINEIKKFEMDYIVEFSGSKGFHIWIFFEEMMPAKSVKALGKVIAQKVKLADTIHIEVFPKQDKIKDDGLGNLIKLPLGIHKKSNKRSWICDNITLEPAKCAAECLKRVKQISRNAFFDILARITGIDYQTYIEKKGDKAFETEMFSWKEYESIRKDTNRSDQKVSGSEHGRPEPEKAAKAIITGCGVLSAIVEKAMVTHNLDHSEKHVLIYVLALAGEEGRTFLHQVLSRTVDYNTHALSSYIHSVPPNPMSCPKIRKHLRKIADLTGCRCRFNLNDGEYPSPLIYARMFPQKQAMASRDSKNSSGMIGSGSNFSFLKDADVFDALISEYKRELKEFKIKAQCLETLVKEIERYFLLNKTLEINTKIGTYKMAEINEHVYRCQTIKFDFDHNITDENDNTILLLPEKTDLT